MLPITAFIVLLPGLYLGKKRQSQQDKANIRDKKIICINVCPRVYMCTTCVWYQWRPRRWCPIPWNWSYAWFWAALWVLGTGSSARAASDLTFWTIFQLQYWRFDKRLLMLSLSGEILNCVCKGEGPGTRTLYWLTNWACLIFFYVFLKGSSVELTLLWFWFIFWRCVHYKWALCLSC